MGFELWVAWIADTIENSSFEKGCHHFIQHPAPGFCGFELISLEHQQPFFYLFPNNSTKALENVHARSSAQSH